MKFLLFVYLIFGISQAASVQSALQQLGVNNSQIQGATVAEDFIQKLVDDGTLSKDLLDIPYKIATNNSRIANQYIFKLKGDTPAAAVQIVKSIVDALSGTILHTYSTVFNGFALSFPGQLPLDAIRRIPYLEYIEEDTRYIRTQTQNLDSQTTWGIDRIDQVSPLLNNQYSFSLTGKGVNVYIIDSGLDTAHQEFDGRGQIVFSTQSGANRGGDCSNHGTHVAGIIGGKNVGVAKEATLFSLQVFDCKDDTSNTDIIAALDFVAKNYIKPAIINMSLGPLIDSSGGYPRSAALDGAIAQVIGLGIPVFAASGNDNQNGCQGTPAGTPNVFTVASTDMNDQRSEFSNFGPCVSMFAPGNLIVSAKSGGGYLTKSGTSQATPHAVGVAALFLQTNPQASPADVAQALRQAAVQGVVRNPLGSQNLLLQAIGYATASASPKLVTLSPPGTVKKGLGQGDGMFSLTTRNIIIGSVIGGVFLLLAVALIASCCYKRMNDKHQQKLIKQRQRQTRSFSSDGSGDTLVNETLQDPPIKKPINKKVFEDPLMGFPTRQVIQPAVLRPQPQVIIPDRSHTQQPKTAGQYIEPLATRAPQPLLYPSNAPVNVKNLSPTKEEVPRQPVKKQPVRSVQNVSQNKLSKRKGSESPLDVVKDMKYKPAAAPSSMRHEVAPSPPPPIRVAQVQNDSSKKQRAKQRDRP